MRERTLGNSSVHEAAETSGRAAHGTPHEQGTAVLAGAGTL